ncbi:Leucine carboxyl methyltransferase 1 [Hypsibius exemplaris]|uniref:Leucine carboxyl methyltransferase 1 n=1 Tax=Hypsibius exemplaris TaxID=2072580 RepID=A0A1W0WKG3_HYPEX|nr:Leucine carboxyl methyltransferase 1 [Hypsibius exemplaris]
MDPPATTPHPRNMPRTNSQSPALTPESDTVNSIPDENIIQTNEEASLCKLDAVKLGYWQDPYLPMMVHGSLRHERKAPDMYKGYYARVKCVERLVLQFIAAVRRARGPDAVVQIVNLGAGYDTLYWRLHANAELVRQGKMRVVDLDLLPVTTKKCHFIRGHKQLMDLLIGEVRDGEVAHGELHSDEYDLISSDIRDTLQIERKLMDNCKLDPKQPTLFIAECVLIYMSTGSTKQLLSWIAKTFHTAAFINYEQVHMDDHFGQIMFDALKAQGCLLADADSCKSLEMHEQRFLKTGWDGAQAADMNQMCGSLPQADVDRVDRIAMIDEPEVLRQLFAHYSITWAQKGGADIGLDKIRLV